MEVVFLRIASDQNMRIIWNDSGKDKSLESLVYHQRFKDIVDIFFRYALIKMQTQWLKISYWQINILICKIVTKRSNEWEIFIPNIKTYPKTKKCDTASEKTMKQNREPRNIFFKHV